jgi:ATP-dependent DNA helicase RecQ
MSKSGSLAIAYGVAWLRVAGGNSVLPPWVHRTFTETSRLIHELREIPCDEPSCGYCRENHHAETLLARDFDKASFRPLPANPDGGSLQRDIVMPASAGRASSRSCRPAPASPCATRSRRSRITGGAAGSPSCSPLQSLMKDKIDNPVRQGIYSAVALNGLLTASKRRQVLDRIALGDAGIVLVSPEQFRNKTLADTRRGREIAAWVFDEAHCLSKWGHNFRTDYLYVTLETDRCPIRHNLMIPKRTVTNCPPISSHKTALSWMV